MVTTTASPRLSPIPVNSGQQPNNSVVFDGDAALQSVLVSVVSQPVNSQSMMTCLMEFPWSQEKEI